MCANGEARADNALHLAGAPPFTAPPINLEFDGLLFDMDGTIVESTKAIEKHWYDLGQQIGVDPKLILHTSHGRRSIDTLAFYHLELANWDYVKKVEGQIPYKYGSDATEVPGARALLDQLDSVGAPWMIVSSGTRPLVTGWLDVLKMAVPDQLVMAEDVDQGKPDPSCYLLGRSRLGFRENAKMLVLEDAPAGVKAGKAAGFTVVALATTHPIERLQEAGADYIVRDMRSVTLQPGYQKGLKVEVQISGALVPSDLSSVVFE